MPNSYHAQAPALSRRSEASPGFTADEADAFAHWQHLVDARLIGAIAELSPATLARHAATEAALGVAPCMGGVW